MAFSSRTKIGFTGYEPFVGVFNELLVAEIQDQISLLFDYGILQYMVHGTITQTTGDGIVTENNDGVLSVSSTTGTAKIYSRDRLTYKTGHTCLVRFTASFNGTGIGKVGLYDTQEGFYIKNNNGTITCVRRNNLIEIEEAINGSLDGIDLSKINVFYLIFGFLGVANPTFWALDINGKPQKIHEFYTLGTLTTTHLRTPVMPITMETSGDMEILSGSWQASLLGNSLTRFAQNFSSYHTVNVGNGQTVVIVNYQSIINFEYKASTTTLNKKKAKLIRFEFFVDSPANGTGTCVFTIDQAMSVSGASWNNVRQYQSVMQYDTVGTPTIAANALTSFIGYAGSVRGASSSVNQFDAENLNLVAIAGDIFSIRVQNTGNQPVNVRVAFNWQEL